MENLRLGWSMIVVVSTMVFACSHEEPREHSTTRADRTSGSERSDARDERRSDDAARATADDTRDDEADDDTPTAFDQSNDERDLEITQAIRVAVVGDDSLSFTARNCTIVTVDAVVTLRGDVNTAAESAAIERHAQAVDGVSRVDNLLSVSP